MRLGRHESAQEAYQRGYQEGYDTGYVQGRLSKAQEMEQPRPKPRPGVLRPVMEETATPQMASDFQVDAGAPVRVVRDMGGQVAGVFQLGPPLKLSSSDVDPDVDDIALD